MRKHGVIAARLTLARYFTVTDSDSGRSPIELKTGSRLAPGPGIERRTAMEQYIGLDVSMKETAISIRQDVSHELRN